MISTVSQQILKECLRKRLKASGRRIEDISSLDDVSRNRQKPLQVIAVIRGYSLEMYIRNCAQFVSGLSKELREKWYHQFTPTVLLLGNPMKVASRITFEHISDNGEMGWTSPADPKVWEYSKRLVKLFKSSCYLPADTQPVRLKLGTKSNKGKEIYLTFAVKGLTLDKYLIHLNHTISECIIEGILEPSDVLIIKNVNDIRAFPQNPRYVRVHLENLEHKQLRAYAVVSSEN